MNKRQMDAVVKAMQLLHDSGVQSIMLTTVKPYDVVSVYCEASEESEAKVALSKALLGAMLRLSDDDSGIMMSEVTDEIKESVPEKSIIKTRRDFIRVVQAVRLALIAYPDIHLKPLILLDQLNSVPPTIPKVSALSISQLNLIRDAIEGEITEKVVSSLVVLTAIILKRERVDAFDTRS